MAQKTPAERAGMFLTALLLLVVGAHLCLLESENRRFQHPGRALQAASLAPAGKDPAKDSEEKASMLDHEFEAKMEKDHEAFPDEHGEARASVAAESSLEPQLVEANQNSSVVAPAPSNGTQVDEIPGKLSRSKVVRGQHHVEDEEDMDEQVLLEMRSEDMVKECHCPSVLNGSLGPVHPKCLQKCSSSFYHRENDRPIVNLKNGPLVFPVHDEF